MCIASRMATQPFMLTSNPIQNNSDLDRKTSQFPHPSTATMHRLSHLETALGGSEQLQKIQSSRVLMVGAGGIGCELLKNLVLSGFGNIEVAVSLQVQANV